MDMCVKLRPSPPMWKFSIRFAREHSFPFYLKEINCFEEMLYRKIDFIFCGLTLFKRALKCITLNKMKKSIVHNGDNVLVFANTKNRFQQRILNVPLGKSHIWICALNYALHLRWENVLSDLQRNIVFHFIWKKLTVLRKCCIEKSTLHFGA